MLSKLAAFKHIILIVLAALFIRAGYVAFFPQPAPEADAVEYETLAGNLYRNQCFALNPGVPTPIRAPGYSIFLAGISAAVGDNYLFPRLAQAVLGALLCLLIYLIGCDIFNRETGTLAALAVALHPVLIVYTGFLLSETLFTFLTALSVWFMLAAIRAGKYRDGAAAGFFFGLSALCRPVALYLPFFIAGGLACLSLLVLLFRRGQRERAGAGGLPVLRTVLVWVVLLLVFAATLTPWAVRNYKQFRAFIPVSIGGGNGVWVTGYMLEHHASWDDAVAAALKKMEPFMQEPVTPVVSGVHPRLAIDKLLLDEGKTMIRAHRVEYAALMLSRLPRFWFTSHSSAFGIDQSLAEYFRNKQYVPVLLRMALLGLQAIIIMLACGGIVLAWPRYPLAAVPVLLLVFFSGHVAIDPCPRYHLPVVPYLIMLASFFTVSVLKRGDSPVVPPAPGGR